QAPAWQVSEPLQASPSEQEAPSGTAALTHLSSCGSQRSAVQALPSSHEGAGPGVQAPAWQVSAPSQKRPSEQEVPSATGVWMQPLGPQESVVQGLLSSQLSGVPGVQAPAWQVSEPLQTLPSEQEAPSAAVTCEQPPVGLQASTVQGLASLQSSGVPGEQTPDWQVSAPLQTLPSEQEVPFATAA